MAKPRAAMAGWALVFALLATAGQGAIYYIDDDGTSNAPGVTVQYDPGASWLTYSSASTYTYGQSYHYEDSGTELGRTATFTFGGPTDDYYVYAGWSPNTNDSYRTQVGAITVNGTSATVQAYPVNHEDFADGSEPTVNYVGSGFYPVKAAGAVQQPIRLGPGSTIVYSDGTETDPDQRISVDVVVVSTDLLIDDISTLTTATAAYGKYWNEQTSAVGTISNGYHYADAPATTDVFVYDIGTALGGPATRELKASWMAGTSRDDAVTYHVTHTGGTTDITVDQREFADRSVVPSSVAWSGFRSLGTFEFDASSKLEVIPSGSDKCSADTIALGADPTTLYERAMQSQPSDCTNYWALNHPDLGDSVGTLQPTSAAGTSAGADILGRPDGGTAFDGASASRIGFAPATSNFADSGTCEAFIRVDEVTSSTSTAQMAIGCRGDSSSDDRLYLNTRTSPSDSSQYAIGMSLGDRYMATEILTESKDNLGEWRYVAFTWEKNAGTGRYDVKTYYADAAGQLQAGGTRSVGGSVPVGAPICFGGYPLSGAHQFEGALDNVAFYSGALTAGQLQQHYNMATFEAQPLLSQYQQGVLATPDLVHYWPLDNRAAEDIIGQIDRGNISSGVATCDGVGQQSGSAMCFDGSSGVLFDAPGVPTVTLGNTGTLEAWVRTDAVSSTYPFAVSLRQTNSSSDRLYIGSGMVGGEEHLLFSFGNRYTPAGTLADVSDRLGDWVYTTVTWEQIVGGPNDGKYLVSSYFEQGGAIVPGGTLIVGGAPPTDAAVAFGRYVWGTDHNFEGGVDEVALYGRVLTLDEMKDHWNLSVPEPTTLTLLGLGGLAALLRRRRR